MCARGSLPRLDQAGDDLGRKLGSARQWINDLMPHDHARRHKHIPR